MTRRGRHAGKTVLRVYDVSDPASPSEAWSLEIDGHLISSRRVGDQLHIVTRFTPLLDRIHAQPVDETEAAANARALDHCHRFVGAGDDDTLVARVDQPAKNVGLHIGVVVQQRDLVLEARL